MASESRIVPSLRKHYRRVAALGGLLSGLLFVQPAFSQVPDNDGWLANLRIGPFVGAGTIMNAWDQSSIDYGGRVGVRRGRWTFDAGVSTYKNYQRIRPGTGRTSEAMIGGARDIRPGRIFPTFGFRTGVMFWESPQGDRRRYLALGPFTDLSIPLPQRLILRPELGFTHIFAVEAGGLSIPRAYVRVGVEIGSR